MERDRGRGKRGRGRGRGIPRDDGGHTPSGRQGFQRGRGFREPSQPVRSPTHFFTASSSFEEATHGEPTSSLAAPKRETKMKTVHPEELGIELKHSSPVKTPFPGRPGVGKLGRRIKLVSNCFPIEVPSGYVYHYDVEIFRKEINTQSEASEDKDIKRYRCLHTKTNRKIISLMLDVSDHFSDLYAAYDGKKNLYTRKELRAEFPLKCEVILQEEDSDHPNGPRQDTYEVVIKPVKNETNSCAINLDTIHALYEKRTTSVPEEAIMALETILRHGPCLRFTPIGRSFFYPSDSGNMHPLGGGLEIWFGYHQSVRFGQFKPVVNLDISHTAFLQEGPLLNYVAGLMDTTVETLRRMPFMPESTIKRISSKLKDKRIIVTHLSYPKKCRILKLDTRKANDIKFTAIVNGEENETTVKRYFKELYNVDLEFPNLPCLRVHSAKSEVYYPIEMCKLTPGQHSRAELTLAQKSEMIKFTSVPPKERFQEIDKIARRKANFKNDSCVKEFGVEVSLQPLGLEGRVLEAPGLLYSGEKKVRPKDGSWNLWNTQFLTGARFNKWVLLNFSKHRLGYLEEFAELFSEIGYNLGIDIGQPEPDHIETFDVDCCKEKLFMKAKRLKAELAIVVLPTIRETEVYGKVKKASEVVVGLITQCIKEVTVKTIVENKKARAQIISNLWLKVNAKMGGENNILIPGEIPTIMAKPVIIIGADVNHPTPSPQRKPSLAACVGCITMNFSKYAVSIKPQFHRNEKKKAIDIILDLKNMVVDLLKAFYRHTKLKPEKIIFYRDGVSEGQFDQVRDHEIASIREAWSSLEKENEVPITFVVVQKRHHVRFRPQDLRDGAGGMKNVPPGTTVDTVVTHPENFDFFLCSQFGLKGTSRPSHYVVLQDDNNFTADALQKITFQLCHMSFRCTKSISIPAPVAYADRVAYRARKHLEADEGIGFGADDDSSSASGSAANILPLFNEAIEAIKISDDLKDRMYFV